MTNSRSGDSASNRYGNPGATSFSGFDSTNLGLNYGNKLPQAVNSKLNGNSAAYFYEALPNFKDVPNTEKQNLFVKKVIITKIPSLSSGKGNQATDIG